MNKEYKRENIRGLKTYKLLVMLIVLFFAFTFNSNSLANNETENAITDDFEISIYSSSNNEVQYGIYVKKDDEDILISIKAEDYNLPSNLNDYKDDIRLRITYLQESLEVNDCKVINYMTGEIIEDLSEEKINELFNIEYGKNVVEKNWTDTIKLSELKENEIYKYTANSTTEFPEIENNVEKNCIIYIKGKYDEVYKKEINMCKEVSGSSISLSYNEYSSGESFSIMYREIRNDELMKLIQEDEIILLSKYNDGDELEYSFEKYIYNDTEKDITVHIKDTSFGIESTDSVIIEKGKIYGFDWMIETATISYLEENDNEEQNGGTNVNEGEEGKTEEDKSTSPSEIPYTGMNSCLSIIILAIIIMIIMGAKLKKFKDIE